MDELRAMALAFQKAHQLSDAEMCRTIGWAYSAWNRFKRGMNVNQANEEKLRIIVCGDRDAHLVPGFTDMLKELLGELDKKAPNQAKILKIDAFCAEISEARVRASVILDSPGKKKKAR